MLSTLVRDLTRERDALQVRVRELETDLRAVDEGVLTMHQCAEALKECDEMMGDFAKALGLPELLEPGGVERPGYPHIMEAIARLDARVVELEKERHEQIHG